MRQKDGRAQATTAATSTATTSAAALPPTGNNRTWKISCRTSTARPSGVVVAVAVHVDDDVVVEGKLYGTCTRQPPRQGQVNIVCRVDRALTSLWSFSKTEQNAPSIVPSLLEDRRGRHCNSRTVLALPSLYYYWRDLLACPLSDDVSARRIKQHPHHTTSATMHRHPSFWLSLLAGHRTT